MIVSFRVKNFKSFQENAELSFVAGPIDKEYSSAIIRKTDSNGKDYSFLPAAAIYGANASGKSNLLIALALMRKAVVYSQSIWKPGLGTELDPFLASFDSACELEIVLLLEGVRYRYGFSGTPINFVDEWLYSYPNGRERALYTRTTQQDGEAFSTDATFGRHLTGERRDHSSSLRRTRENSLLLSSLAQDNQVEAQKLHEYFHQWGSVQSRFDEANEQQFTSQMAERHGFFKEALMGLLKTADPDVEDIEIQKLVPEGRSSDPASFLSGVEGAYEPAFITKFGDEKRRLSFSRQSRGMKRMYAISNEIIYALLNGSVMIFDEIDASMHPHMVAKLVGIFQNASTNPRNAQIVFSTHDTALLRSKTIRRDQIWFVEKTEGRSELYSLLEYAPRREEDISAAYLRGRYGAVPKSGVDLALMGLGDFEGWSDVDVAVEDVLRYAAS